MGIAASDVPILRGLKKTGNLESLVTLGGKVRPVAARKF